MQLRELAERLQAAGFSDKQSRIYVAALFLGAAPVQKIAEQAGVNRPTTYDILDELTELGLISRSTENSKTLFIAASPEALQHVLEHQDAELQHRKQQLHALLPDLQHIHRTADRNVPSVRFVRGLDGIQAALDELHRSALPKSEILAIINEDEVLRALPQHVPVNAKKRLSKRIRSKQFVHNSRQTITDMPETLRESLQVKTPFAGDVTLFESKALLVAYGEDPSSWTGVVIENEKIVETLRQIFMIAWVSLRK